MTSSAESIVSGPGAGAHFTAIDYTVFISMLITSASIGVWFGFFNKGKQTTDDYLMGGRKMKTIPIAISLIASQLTSISIITMPVEMYSFGSQYLLICPNFILIILCVSYITLPVFCNNSLDNCYAYLELRFNRAVRHIITATFLIAVLGLLPVILFIPSLALSQVTGYNLHLINGLVGFICVFYTVLGGIKAVVWTDVFQASIMVISILSVAALGISRVGGVDEVWRRGVAGNRVTPFDFTFDLTTRNTFWNLWLGYFVSLTATHTLNQSTMQRIVALPSLQHSRRAMQYFGVGVVIIVGMNCLTGLIMFAYYYNCDPIKAKIVQKYDQLLPYFVQDITSDWNGMSGLFISCVFSASLSTIAPYLNALAGIIYKDYVQPRSSIKHDDSKATFYIKVITFLLGVFCISAGVVVDRFTSLYQLVNTIAGCTVGTIFGVFLLGMLYPWANAKGALCGIIASLCGTLTIILGAQYLIAEGNLVYHPLPTSIEGCTNNQLTLTANMTNIGHSMGIAIEDEGFSLFKMSFLWYGVFGTLLFWAVAIPVSHLTGAQDLDKLNLQLLTPAVKHLVLRRRK